MGMEEKIGVLTFVYNENYGSALQAFALQRILTPWSREVKHLCYTPDTKERIRRTAADCLCAQLGCERHPFKA